MVFGIFSIFPAMADAVYREFIFQIFRVIWDYTIGLLPFPIIYLLLIALPFMLYFYGRKFERKKITLLLFPLNLFGWIIALFLWMWGYNYCTTPLVAKSSHQYSAISLQDIYDFGVEIGSELKVHAASASISPNESTITSDQITQAVEAFLQKKNRRTWGNAIAQTLHDGGFLRRMGISGIYIPFVGQGHSSRTHHASINLFVLAHETSHAYGISGEGEADFVGYKSLSEFEGNGKEEMQFAAKLELLRSIRGQLHISNDSMRIALDSTLDESIKVQLRWIKEDQLKYPEFFPGMQHAMNDNYLKMMGVADGVQNYDRFVEMVWNDRRQKSVNKH